MDRQRVQQLPMKTRQGHDAIINAPNLTDIPAVPDEWKCKRSVTVPSKTLNANTDKISQLKEKLGSRVVAEKLCVAPHTPYEDVFAIAKLLNEHRADSNIPIDSSSYSDGCEIARLIHATLGPDDLTEEAMEKLVDQDNGVTRRGPSRHRK